MSRRKDRGPSLFDPHAERLFASREARDDAIDQVEDAAEADWLARAHVALDRVARACHNFTTDDVWASIEAGEDAHEPRAMGPVMRNARVAGLIEPVVGFYRQSRSAICHARPKQVWRLVVEGQAETSTAELIGLPGTTAR